MTPSYLVRFLLLASASFFLFYCAAAASVAACITPAALAVIRSAGIRRPRRAARILLALRLLPAAFSTFFVAVLCVPSYLRFEPRQAEEEVSLACALFAILGVALCAIALYRVLAALLRSALYVRQCSALESILDGEKVLITRHGAGLALAGIVQPRLLISHRAVNELPSDQLTVALRHEHAHRASFDNLKRLLILLAPPVFPKLRALDRAWAQCAEWAADDRAVAGDASRAVALASALVRVARLQSGFELPPLVTSLVEADEDLSVRVDRLLLAAPVTESSRLLTLTLASAAMLSLFAAISLNPGALRVVHELLERIYDLW